MSAHDEFIQRQRAVWAAGRWDDFSNWLAPVTPVVLGQLGDITGKKLLDVGTGSGGTIAVPAALSGARVTGCDITTELFEHGRRRAVDAGVEVNWVEGNAQDLPFEDDAFDLVTSTFGAMFAPDHKAAAAELVRVCRPGGTIVMTTWSLEGFIDASLSLNGKYLPPPPPGVEPTSIWGVDDHVRECFGAAGVEPEIERHSVDFVADSVEHAVQKWVDDLGLCIMARRALEPQGRWDDYMTDFEDIVRRFAEPADGGIRIESIYLVIRARP